MSISFNQLNGTSVSDASGNTTLGTFSLQGAEFLRGLNNTAIGYGALRANDESAQHNTAIGLNSLSNNDGSNNLAIGENALYNFLTPTAHQSGDYNVAIGANAMQWNTSGHDNVALGNQALYNNTTGYLNVAIGNNALQGTGTGTGNGTGAYNVAIGHQALNNNGTGIQNAVVGMGAGYYNTTGSNNAALGYNAMLQNTTGSNIVAVGDGALIANQTGNSIVAVGNGALQAHTTGDGNIAIGDFALSSGTTGTDNIGIGLHASANGNSSCILLGNYAQTMNDNELAMSGINLIAPSDRILAGYLPIRFNNYNIGSTAGIPFTQYYIPIYAGLQLLLPVPEVIIANHGSLGPVGSGGVGLLIGFPSDYSAVTSVVIANGPSTYTITGVPSHTGYYVFYENPQSQSGFWPGISSSYANLAQPPVLNPGLYPGLCAGLVFGNPLTFTYTNGSGTKTVTYSPLAKSLNIGDGYQYQQYNGQAAFTPASAFQWGGTGTGNPGTESWGEQVGTGTQSYTAWQGVPSNYQYNSIYKELYPFTTLGSSPAPASLAPTPTPTPNPVSTKIYNVTSGTETIIAGTGQVWGNIGYLEPGFNYTFTGSVRLRIDTTQDPTATASCTMGIIIQGSQSVLSSATLQITSSSFVDIPFTMGSLTPNQFTQYQLRLNNLILTNPNCPVYFERRNSFGVGELTATAL